MEYDKKDQAIIESLYHNWRMSSSKLSRKLRLSRRMVDYRINQYFYQGVIRAIFGVFNYSKLGFDRPAYAFICLTDKKKVEEIGKFLEKSGRCISWGRAWTDYDIFSNFIFKNKKEMTLFFKKLNSSFNGKIDDITIVDPIHAEFFPLKSIGNNLNETYLLTEKTTKISELDEIDLKILKEIASNARKPIVEIAERIKISPERCLYRIRRLVKEKIILGSRIQFGLKNAGYFATCLFIKTKLTRGLNEELQQLCKNNPNINYLITSKKNPEIIIQVFHRNEETLREVIKRAAELLKSNPYTISLVKLEEDINIVNPLPFFER